MNDLHLSEVLFWKRLYNKYLQSVFAKIKPSQGWEGGSFSRMPVSHALSHEYVPYIIQTVSCL